VLSEILILLVIRTRRSFFRSRPGAGLVVTSVGVAMLTVLLPYVPLAPALGFVPLSAALVGAVAVIVMLYTVSSEITKRLTLRLAPGARRNAR
jgi:P-type Mg2+ transporter